MSDTFFQMLARLSCHLIIPFSPCSPCLQSIGKLRQLRYLDLAKNRIETLDTDISGCEALEDLLLSSNMLQHLPDTIGTHLNTYRHICMHAQRGCRCQVFPRWEVVPAVQDIAEITE